MKARHWAMVFISAVALAGALCGVNRWGLALKRQATEMWLQKASDETQRITDTSLYWLSLTHTQLRGLAALFYGSERVTKNEFLDALELIEGVEVESVTPLTTFAYVEQQMPRRAAAKENVSNGPFPATLSSDAHGLLAAGNDAASHPHIRAAIADAMNHPEQVIQGAAFKERDGRVFVVFAVAAPNGGKPGVLLSLVNLNDFVADLDTLLIPKGVRLRIVERAANRQSGADETIVGARSASAETVGTLYFPSQIGHAHWGYYWDILPGYLGGPDTMLGTAMQLGGSALVLTVFAIFGVLAMQNVQVNRLVTNRTAELEVATQKAETASLAKSAFLANMSHELRTPMNAILGYSQLMQRDRSLQPGQQGYLSIINRSGEHLLALINDVLEISRIEAGRVRFETGTFDLAALFGDLDAMFRIRTDAKGLRFETTGIDAVPRHVIGDENKLRQILINLLGNAVKFTEEGEIVVRVATTGAGERMRLAVEVEDTGMGIAREELGKVFQSFEQTASGWQSKSGTGLGLAISREYARLMGGDIAVSSTAGKGSTFRLEIDIKPGNASDLKKDACRSRVTALAPGQTPPRILVAEDNDENRALLVALLQGVGFEVREAMNGREAIDIFEQWQPQFIWMDIRMPVMDGLEATRRIKATAAGSRTSIAALTAHALEEERDMILKAGCDLFVRKPYREHEIFEAMAERLGVRYLYEQGTHPSEPPTRLPPGQLAAAVSDELRDELRQAALRLNGARTMEVIEKIALRDACVGAALKAFVEKLDFDGLLGLLDDAASKPEEEDV